MENKIFEFPQTSQAISALSADIVKIISALKTQRVDTESMVKQYKNTLQKKDKTLEALQQSSSEILNNLDGIISQLDKVLEENGSSNNNN